MSGPGRIVPDPASDPDLRAAEYVLGTLDARERSEMEREAASDPEAAGRVQAWEQRLAPLMSAVAAVTPPPRVREALLRTLPTAVSRGAAVSPEQIVSLRRQVRRWRNAAAGAGLLAAGLALFVAVGSGLRQDAPTGRYLAVVQGGGARPALIVRVDLQAGTAQVRPVGAEAPAGKSLELWYVGARRTTSLGLIGAGPSRVALPEGASPEGVIAVSVEPPGGSPSGQATGPVVYTGKLITD